jgi:hypothetical protein
MRQRWTNDPQTLPSQTSFPGIRGQPTFWLQVPALFTHGVGIRRLDKKFRQDIHDLETRCDKSGDVQTIAILREDPDALQQRVEELEARIALQEREYLEAPIPTD